MNEPLTLTSAQATKLLTEIIGRKITYKRLSVDEGRKLYLALGRVPGYAEYMVGVDSAIATGLEEDIFHNADENKKFVGKHTLREYFETNRDIWVKK